MKRTGFLAQIRADAAKDEAELLIYDEIGKNWFGDGVSAKQVVKDLAAIKASTIRVRINSAGGEVFEGLAIYEALKRHDAKVVVEIDSLAASIASVIALAGAEIRMAENAFFMIHNPHSIAWGNAADMREVADLLDKVGGSLSSVYVARTGKPLAEVQAWMDAETWFTAEEAKAAGFVDSITAGKEIKACADLRAFVRTPAMLAELMKEEEEDPKAGAPMDPREDEKPEAAAGDAEPEEEDEPPAQPASKAKENTMSDKDTAAQTIAAERERSKKIRALGETHRIEGSKVNGWIDDGKSVDEVNALILAELEVKSASGPKTPRVSGVQPRAEKDPRFGFESHREFLVSVMKNSGARSRDAVREERLRPLAVVDEEGVAEEGVSFMVPRGLAPRSVRAAAGSDEQGNYSDSYGGFLQPRQVMPGLLSIDFEGDPTAGLTQNVPMAAPIVTFNARVDKNHSTSVSGGLTFTRTPETAAATASRMQVEQVELKAQALVGLAYATEEVLRDSPVSFAALLSSGFDAQRGAHLLNEKLFGVGGAQYTGIVNASCTISVSKETNQAAATIVADNVMKMAARCWGYGSAVWLANHNCKPQLAKLAIVVGTSGQLLYQPSQNAGFPDMLWGRPVLYTEFCKTVGTVGDLVLANMTQFLEGIYQPMQSEESIHVRFVNLERCFRFYERNCGAPWWRSALTPKNGDTLSPFVTLATRA